MNTVSVRASPEEIAARRGHLAHLERRIEIARYLGLGATLLAAALTPARTDIMAVVALTAVLAALLPGRAVRRGAARAGHLAALMTIDVLTTIGVLVAFAPYDGWDLLLAVTIFPVATAMLRSGRAGALWTIGSYALALPLLEAYRVTLGQTADPLRPALILLAQVTLALLVAGRDDVLGGRIESAGETRRRRFLAEATRSLLARATDSESAARDIARVSVPELADACLIELRDDDGHVRRAAAAHVNEASIPLMLRIAEAEPAAGRASDEVMRSGRSLLIEEVGEDDIARLAESAVARERMRAELRSLAIIPLAAHGEPLGTITLYRLRASGRRSSPADLAQAQEFSHLAALIIEHARLYEAARDAAAARDRLLASIAHDLRSPIGFLSSGLDTLRGEPPPSAGQREALMTRMRGALRRMARMADDLSDATASTEPVVIAAPTDLATVVERVRLEHAEAERVTVEWSGPKRVEGDEPMLERAFANIITNALRYSDPPRLVRVTAAASARDGHAGIEVSVVDSGVGITADDLPHIFTPFWRGRTHAAAVPRGRGLGLAIVRQIVRAHGGEVTAASRPGVGSTFTVWLPLAGPAPAATGSEPGEPQRDSA